MSRFVSVYRNGEFHTFFKLKHALKKIATGRYRWIDEPHYKVEEIPAEARPHRQIFHDPPASARFDWRPRPSGVTHIRVWQAHWSKQAAK